MISSILSVCMNIRLGNIKFTSCTYRLFKNKSDDFTFVGEKTGALVSYVTPMIHYEDTFQLNQSITFKVYRSTHCTI